MASVTALSSAFSPSNHRLSRSSPPTYQINFSSTSRLLRSITFRSPRSCRRRGGLVVSSGGIPKAYISAPGSDAIVTESEPKASASEEGTSELQNAVSWGLLWSLIGRHKLRLAISGFSLVGCTACTLSMPIFSGRFFEVLIGARPGPLWKLLANVGILYALEPVFTIIFVINMNTIWEKVMSSLRAQVFRRMLIQKVGELTGLLTTDLGSLNSVVTGTICILFLLSPQLAPILGVLMLAVSVSVAVYKRSTVPVFKAHGLAQASMSDCITETFSAIRTVRSFNGEKRQMSMFGNQVLAYEASGIKLGAFKSINESLTRAAVYVSLLALYSLGGSKVKAGELSVGTVASFIGYTFTLTFAVQGLVNTFGDLRGSLAATERINSVLSRVEADEALAFGSISTESMVSKVGHTEDSDVHFSYPLRPDVEILTGLNLLLKCGTVTALVGSSGAGKSTIVQLLARFYEEPVLFSVSVGENIAYGLPDDDVSKDDIIRAAKAANAHDFIISLPQGYDTLVGERGGLLSGGQRQRVAIARALLKNAPILILDEVSSLILALGCTQDPSSCHFPFSFRKSPHSCTRMHSRSFKLPFSLSILAPPPPPAGRHPAPPPPPPPPRRHAGVFRPLELPELAGGDPASSDGGGRRWLWAVVVV
ncbi:unnamed protein product [Rhodiola kirilowii]